jgi:hypothetical protein
MSGLGLGCVKTCTSRERAEFVSLFSTFDGDCLSGSFLIQRNRDKLSTRKFDVGVFTHGVIPGQGHTEALGISSPGIDEAHLLGLAMTGELQWSIMSDWTYR